MRPKFDHAAIAACKNRRALFLARSSTGEVIDGPPAFDELPVIDDNDIARLREALAPWARKPRPEKPKARPKGKAIPKKRLKDYAEGTLRNICFELGNATEGRPTLLYKGVCSVGWAVHHNHLKESDVAKAFIDACDKNGLLGREGARAIDATIDSGLRKSGTTPSVCRGPAPR